MGSTPLPESLHTGFKSLLRSGTATHAIFLFLYTSTIITHFFFSNLSLPSSPISQLTFCIPLEISSENQYFTSLKPPLMRTTHSVTST